MVSTNTARPMPRGPTARTSSYEIKVTREVSVDSRPESRKKMHYTTFPPSAAVQPRSQLNNIMLANNSSAPTNGQPPPSADSNAPKPFADFSFSNSNDVDSIQNTLTGGGLRARTSTLDLAQFLRTTSPPQSRGPSPSPQQSRKSSVAKKLSLGFFRSGSGSSKHSRNTPTPPPGPIQLPDTVVARTAANGKKYLLISVPTSSDTQITESSASPYHPYHQAPPVQAPRVLHPVTVTNPSSSNQTLKPVARSERSNTLDTQGSIISAFRPLSRGQPPKPKDNLVPSMLQPPSSSQSHKPAPSLDEDITSTYHSYLQSQNHTSEQGGSARTMDRASPNALVQSVQNARRPNTAESAKGGQRPSESRESAGSTATDEEQSKGKHSRAYSQASDTPSHKSVSIHPHGLPSRTSSANNQQPALKTGSLSMAQVLHEPVGQVRVPIIQPTQTTPSAQTQQVGQRLTVPPSSDNQRLSHASTAPSMSESIGGSSDASSGVVMDAQIAQAAKGAGNVGFYSNSARKPPRPGPAPTRALPSLPETHDDAKVIRARKSVNSMRPEIVHSSLEVPERTTVIESPVVGDFIEATSRPIFDPPSRTNTMNSTNSSYPDQRPPSSAARAASAPGAVPTAETLRNSRKSREERVRARKMRDLQSIRARHENAKLDNVPGAQSAESTTGVESAARSRNSQASQVSQASIMTDSSSGGSTVSHSSLRPSIASTSSSRRVSATGVGPAPLRRLSRDHRRRQNAVSPVMLVMDQEPATGLTHTSSSGVVHVLKKKQSGTPSVAANGTPTPPRSPSPSLPSSDDDTSRRAASKATDRTHTPSTSISLSGAGEGRSSVQSLNKGKENEIDARLFAMERKNAVLEAALMAVLQTTVGFGQSPQQQQRMSGSSQASQARWSGSVASSSAPTPLEALMQSMAITQGNSAREST